jgi:hypothetical protein
VHAKPYLSESICLLTKMKKELSIQLSGHFQHRKWVPDANPKMFVVLSMGVGWFGLFVTRAGG